MSTNPVYSFSREMLPSSGIDISVMARFTSPSATNLILSRGNMLQIYELVYETPTVSTVPDEKKTPLGQNAGSGLRSNDAETDDIVDTDLALPRMESVDSFQPPFGARLERIKDFKLNGIVTSIGVVRTQTSVGLLGMDSLLLSFRDAKMSLVEFSMGYQTLVTVSLHHYEREDLVKSSALASSKKQNLQRQQQPDSADKGPRGYSKRRLEDESMEDIENDDPSSHSGQVSKGKIHLTADKPPPVVRVDPLSRCALLWYFGEKLALLPFKTEDFKAGTGGNLNNTQATPNGKLARRGSVSFMENNSKNHTPSSLPFTPSFTAWFTDLDPSIRNVIDCCFLHGFYEPTLAVLYQNRQTCTGRVGQLKDTVSLIVLSIDMQQKKYPVLFKVDGLPYNTTHMIPMPPPVGGVLIFSHNAIIHTDQTHAPGLACIVNSYFDLEVELKPAWQENIAPEYIPPSLKRIPSQYSSPGRNTDYRELGLSLDGCRAVVLNPDTVLLLLRSGQAFQIDLVGDENAGRGWKRRKAGVSKFLIQSLGFCMAPPTDITLFHQDRDPFPSRRVLSAPNEYSFGVVEENGVDAGLGSLQARQDTKSSERGGLFQGPGGSMLWFGYFFVASRAADGMLVQFIHTEHGTSLPKVSTTTTTGENGIKQLNGTDNLEDENDTEMTSIVEQNPPSESSIGKDDNNPKNTDADILDDDDDLDSLYGDSTPASKPVKAVLPSYSSHTRDAIMALDDDFDMDLYGDSGADNQRDGGPQDLPWMFCLQDRILVSGPSRDFSMGVPVMGNPVFPYATYNSGSSESVSKNPQLEFVSCGGEHPYGSLIVQSESVRPIILSSFDLPGITDLWTVSIDRSGSSSQGYSLSGGFGMSLEEVVPGPSNHDYAVLSMKNRTMILRTGDELEELTGSDFYTKGPTIAVGTLGGHSSLAPGTGFLSPTTSGPTAPKKHHFIVQIYDRFILILDSDGKKVALKSIGRAAEEGLIRFASISDPFITILTQSGDVKIYSFDASSKSLVSVGNIEDRHIMSFFLYTDSSRALYFVDEQNSSSISTKSSAKLAGKKAKKQDHGSNGTNRTPATVTNGTATDDMEVVNEFNVSQMAYRHGSTRQFLFFVDKHGDLTVLSIPDMKECLFVPKLSHAPSVAFDTPNYSNHGLKQSNTVSSSSNASDTSLKRSNWVEIIVTSMGRSPEREIPYFISRSETNEIYVYKLLPYIQREEDPIPQDAILRGETLSGQGIEEQRLALRLIRQQFDGLLLSKDVIQSLDDSNSNTRTTASSAAAMDTPYLRRHLIPFDSIGSDEGGYYSGVFISGSRPCFLLCSVGSRSASSTDFPVIDESIAKNHTFVAQPWSGSNSVWVHPFTIDGPVHAFGAFHNSSIQYGFMYINASQSLRLANLPAQFNFDSPWPICKAMLPRKPEKLAYHYASETYILATSERTPFLIEKAKHASCVAAGVITEQDELPDQERKIIGIGPSFDLRPGMYLPDLNGFQLELVSPVTWETVDIVQLHDAEQVLCIEPLELASSETQSGRKLFVAIGTCYFRAEDLSCRGRLLLYEIIDVVPEPDNPQTNHKFKFVCSIEEKQPISAICAVNGYLLAAIGSKLIMYELEDKELNGVAFLDVNLYTTSLRSVKNLIVVTDICKSLWFAAFQEEPPKMTVLGRDLIPLKITCGEFMIDEDNLMMVASDLEKNIHVLSYSPFHVHSEAGLRLVRNGEMHLGQVFWKLMRLRLRSPTTTKDTPDKHLNTEEEEDVENPAHQENKVQRFGAVACSEDGGLSAISPVPEKVYKRLYALYTRMVTQIPPHAGLNPRGFRSLQLRVKPLNIAGTLRGAAGARGILDGDYLATYLTLPLTQQRELAQAIGSSEVRILNDLFHFYSEFAYF